MAARCPICTQELENVRAVRRHAAEAHGVPGSEDEWSPLPGPEGQPGWYTDPWNSNALRFWDGHQWSGKTAVPGEVPEGPVMPEQKRRWGRGPAAPAPQSPPVAAPQPAGWSPPGAIATMAPPPPAAAPQGWAPPPAPTEQSAPAAALAPGPHAPTVPDAPSPAAWAPPAPDPAPSPAAWAPPAPGPAPSPAWAPANGPAEPSVWAPVPPDAGPAAPDAWAPAASDAAQAGPDAWAPGTAAPMPPAGLAPPALRMAPAPPPAPPPGFDPWGPPSHAAGPESAAWVPPRQAVEAGAWESPPALGPEGWTPPGPDTATPLDGAAADAWAPASPGPAAPDAWAPAPPGPAAPDAWAPASPEPAAPDALPTPPPVPAYAVPQGPAYPEPSGPAYAPPPSTGHAPPASPSYPPPASPSYPPPSEPAQFQPGAVPGPAAWGSGGPTWNGPALDSPAKRPPKQGLIIGAVAVAIALIGVIVVAVGSGHHVKHVTASTTATTAPPTTLAPKQVSLSEGVLTQDDLGGAWTAKAALAALTPAELSQGPCGSPLWAHDVAGYRSAFQDGAGGFVHTAAVTSIVREAPSSQVADSQAAFVTSPSYAPCLHDAIALEVELALRGTGVELDGMAIDPLPLDVSIANKQSYVISLAVSDSSGNADVVTIDHVELFTGPYEATLDVSTSASVGIDRDTLIQQQAERLVQRLAALPAQGTLAGRSV